MKIGELANKTGMAASAIRFYEQSGLLPPPERGANGYRIYSDAALKRLQLVQIAQNLGFSLDSLRSAFAGSEDFSRDDLLERLDARVREIDQLMAGLRVQRQDLATIRATLRDTWSQGECADPAALADSMASARNKLAPSSRPKNEKNTSVHAAKGMRTAGIRHG
ncbi:MerR family transcriptional regulator [Variovorax sp. VaC1]|uniref:MerR family transcriptional regulator n=1 Tax=Variovorax sp. VaC1 TaxID=3373132 RepID=UPI003749FF52